MNTIPGAISRFLASLLCISLLTVTVSLRVSSAPSTSTADLSTLAAEAYVYAYPLVVIGTTVPVMTNVEKPRGTLAPINQLAALRTYPTAAFKDVVRPNADTLYVSGWMDLAKEPMVLSIPAMGKRYALFPLLNMWTDVFESPGMRTTGTAPQTYAITGPGWNGTLPAGVKQYKSATRYVWMIGRIYCDGTAADYKAAHAIEDQITLVPLSSYGTAYVPPAASVNPGVDMKLAPGKQVTAMSGKAYFTRFAEILKNNPPLPSDGEMVAVLGRLGITPGSGLDWDKLDPSVKAALEAAPKAGQARIAAFAAKAGKVVNGWTVALGWGDYGTNYDLRAFVAEFGLGANQDKDAVYPATTKPLDGSKNYVMHFAKGKLPPVRAFWSLTMYNSAALFYDNPLNRYNVSQRDQFNLNPDGSLDIYVQHASPGAAKQANWLPSPADKFTMLLRLYWPTSTPPSILDGTWEPPAVTAV
jgi:hypothetical protein